MANVPTTSETLLKDLANDSQNARWGEFVARYRPMMAAFMYERYPTLEADEVIQETLISLIRIFPIYHYVPEETGHFHNYLTGILKHKALDLLRKQKRRSALKEKIKKDPAAKVDEDDEDLKSWQEEIFEIAMQQFLADETIHERSKQVFLRLTVDGEKPEAVAASLGMERNAVDKIKSRMMKRLRELVKALEQVGNI